MTEKHTSDTAACKSAVVSFVDDVTDGLDTPQQRYRAMAHAMSLLKPALVALRTAAFEANRAAAALNKSMKDMPEGSEDPK